MPRDADLPALIAAALALLLVAAGALRGGWRTWLAGWALVVAALALAGARPGG